MKELKKFAGEVARVMNERSQGMTATVREVMKNNGAVKIGIDIRKEGEAVAPCMYLSEENMWKSPEQVADQLLMIYKEHMGDATARDGIQIAEKFTDWNLIKGSICFKLVNKEKNGELLKEIPSRCVDWAPELVVIYYVGTDMGGSFASVTVRNEHLSRWGGVSEEDLWKASLENTPERMPVDVMDMADLLVGMTGETIPTNQMVVISNRQKVNGASVLLYPMLQNRLSEKYGKYVILPSSIHEVILLPEKMAENPTALASLVEEVNTALVVPEEVLGGDIYRWNGDQLAPWAA